MLKATQQELEQGSGEMTSQAGHLKLMPMIEGNGEPRRYVGR